MRFGISVGIALVICSAGVSFSAEAAQSAAEEIKIASANGVSSGGQKVAVAAKKPVTSAAVTVQAKPKRAAPTLIAKINLNSQRMRVTSNGKLIGSWAISSGATGHETPPGRFRPKWSSKMHYSRKYYNSPMPYSVFFNGGIATHGTTATGRLGRPASHGCIRLRTPNARKFYQLVHRHGYKRTRIVVTGRAKQTRTASRSRRRSYSRRRNSFATPAAQRGRNPYGVRRYSVSQYDRSRLRRHQQRVRRYHTARRLVYPGDRR